MFLLFCSTSFLDGQNEPLFNKRQLHYGALRFTSYLCWARLWLNSFGTSCKPRPCNITSDTGCTFKYPTQYVIVLNINQLHGYLCYVFFLYLCYVTYVTYVMPALIRASLHFILITCKPCYTKIVWLKTIKLYEHDLHYRDFYFLNLGSEDNLKVKQSTWANPLFWSLNAPSVERNGLSAVDFFFYVSIKWSIIWISAAN